MEDLKYRLIHIRVSFCLNFYLQKKSKILNWQSKYDSIWTTKTFLAYIKCRCWKPDWYFLRIKISGKFVHIVFMRGKNLTRKYWHARRILKSSYPIPCQHDNQCSQPPSLLRHRHDATPYMHAESDENKNRNKNFFQKIFTCFCQPHSNKSENWEK